MLSAMNIVSPPSAMVSPGTSTVTPTGASATDNQRASQSASTRDQNAQGLDAAQLKQLADLKARDREVRAHESAHQAVGGQYAGAISYVYQRGPDGVQYAVGGEVSIDTAPVEGDLQATIEKMRTVRAAALAPAEPSPQDRAVAAQAMQLMLQAQSELALESSEGAESERASADLDGPARISQDASAAYQSVSGLDLVNDSGPASEPFRATA